jgi:undecaprenyl-phosphate 4-deoxy-4-formamido-L-arabinose transferase
MRRASGRFLVNLDDDLQNPVEEAVRLLRHLRDSGAEVVYSRYETKQHPWLRNLGSSLINRCATLVMQKPAELYLSSFRALRAELAARITSRSTPWPHIDGLILTATQHISTLTVRHEPRQHGSSQYSLRKLLRLASSVVFDSSILPLRAASVLGVLLFLAGGALLLSVAWQRLLHGTLPHGWDSLIGVVCLFCGAQFLMLGVVGEYLGRVWLTLAGKPQSHVRTVIPRTP